MHIPIDPRKLDRYTNWLIPSLLAVLAFLFYAAVWAFAINVPIVDDALLVFTLTRILDQATPWSEALRLMTEQHNDHRILGTRLIVLLAYWLTGEVNFRTLTLVGSLTIAGFVWVFQRLFLQANVPGWAIVPVALLLAQPSYQEDVWWVICLFQHTLTALLTLLLFCWIDRPGRWNQVGAMVLGTFILYANTNGLFVWIAVIGLLLIVKQWRRAMAWLAVGAVVFLLYFSIDYAFRSQGAARAILAHPGWVANALLHFLGGSVYFDGRRWLLLPASWLITSLGLVVLAVMVGSGLAWLTNRRRPVAQALRPLLGLSFVLVCTGAAAAVARADGSVFVVPRYQIFSVLCLVLTYALMIVQTQGRARQLILTGATLAAGWFWLNAWLLYGPQLADRHNGLVADASSLKKYDRSVLFQAYLADPFWQALWQKARQQRLYNVPELPEIAALDVAMQAPVFAEEVRFQQDSSFSVAHNVPDYQLANDSLVTPDFLCLWSLKRWYLLPAQPPLRSLWKPRGSGVGVRSHVMPTLLEPGTYRIGWAKKKPTGTWEVVCSATQFRGGNP